MAEAPSAALIGCPECGAVIEVPITYGQPEILTAEDGTQALNVPMETDMADLWAHAWTHTEETP